MAAIISLPVKMLVAQTLTSGCGWGCRCEANTKVPGAPRFRGGPADFFGPRGCLWRHVFRDHTARFWADILYMYRGAVAPRFNIKII